MAAIVFLGGALRLVGIGTESFWADEVHSIVTARRPYDEILTTTIGNNQPFYFLVLRGWVSLFGEGETAARMPSLIFGVLTIPATYLLARQFMTRPGSLLAAAFVAVAPVMVWYSQEARMYSLLALLVVVSTLLLVLYFRQGKLRFLTGYAVVAFLAMYTHYYFAPYLAAQDLVALVLLVKRRSLKTTMLFALVQIVVLMALLIRLGVLSESVDSGLDDLPAGSALTFLKQSAEVVGLADAELPRTVMPTVVVWTVWALLFGGVVIALRKRHAILLVVSAAAVPLLVLVAGRQFFDLPVKLRYAVAAVPLWGVMAGYAGSEAWDWVQSRNPLRSRIVSTALLCSLAAIVAGSTLFAWNQQYDSASKQQWRELASLMHSAARSTDIVHAYPNPKMTPLDLYLEKSPTAFAVRPTSSARCDEGRRVWLVQSRAAEPLSHIGDVELANLQKNCPALDFREFAGNMRVYLFGPNLESASQRTIPLCNGLEPTVVGSPDGDIMNGTDGDDVIVGLDGDDEINSRLGNDTVCGGGGNDTLTGAAGNDTLLGEAGDDTLNGNSGDDIIDGGEGDDRVAGNDGNDTHVGGDGADRLSGGEGDDMLLGDAGADVINGGAGTDSLYGGVGSDRLDGEEGNDRLYGELGLDKLSGGPGNDLLEAGDGDDLLVGGEGGDVLAGGAGNDSCDVDTSDDTKDGCEAIAEAIP